MAWGQWTGSLRFRLSAISLVAIVATLFVAHQVLTGLFERQVTEQFQSALKVTLDQLAAGVSVDPATQRITIKEPQGDPRWTKPYSGTYWQISSSDTVISGGLQRSRSLWDFTLWLSRDSLIDGAVHVHQVDGPNQQQVMALERTVRLDLDGVSAQIRLIAAADMKQLRVSIQDFNQTLVFYLAILAAVLTLVLMAQLIVGLAPLKRLNLALTRLRSGQSDRLEGEFPAEIKPLAENFNQVLSDYTRHVERARTLSGNLAHAVKTPLAVMSNSAVDESVSEQTLREIVRKYSELAQNQVNWHLKRARMAVDVRIHRQSIDVAQVVEDVFKVMRRAFAEKNLKFEIMVINGPVYFKGEAQDLLEILGNMIENAAKWANKQVLVTIERNRESVGLVVADDGPGLDSSKYSEILKRGVRMDEQAPGSGLGLAIVSELVTLYRGELSFSTSALGGLSAHAMLFESD